MLKALNTSGILQGRYNLGQFVCHKCSKVDKNNSNNKQPKLDPPIKPLSLSYNSYENRSSDPNVPPVLIMHGLFGSKQNWRSISKALHTKTTRKVIAIDARNHGESPHSLEHRYVDLAEDINHFYKEHKIDKAVVIGHSMGGRAMMAFAMKYPQLVEKAIIVDVSPVTTSPALSNMGEIFSAMKRVRFPPNIDLPQARILADKQLKVSIPEQVTRSFILMNLYKTPTGLIKWRSNVESLDCNFGKHIARFVGPQQLVTNAYTAPMLFIGGRKSDYLTGPKELEKIQAVFPQADLKFLDTGHLVQVEAPNEFIDMTVDFINAK